VASGDYRVGLVVDPSFGVRLEELARRMHVWVVRSPDNEPVVRRIWDALQGENSLESGATLFGSDTESREKACEGIVGTIEEHHGEDSHDPAVNAIEVFGVAPTASIREAFATYGFDEVKVFGDSFVASRGRR
jgi:hypothetical protein